MHFKRTLVAMAAASLLVVGAVGNAAAGDTRPVLSMPVDCFIGVDCWVQNLVDTDPGKGYRDPFCGRAAFDTHKGTDIRVADLSALERGLEVRAMAPGRVVGSRNQMTDALVTNLAGVKAVQGVECGNGVMLDHGGGWTTQYCHLNKGSIAVANGHKVERGQKLGLMGLSGHTTFPHLHFTVRQGKAVIDPITGRRQDEGCDVDATRSKTLFDAQAANQIDEASSAIVNMGFAGERVDRVKILRGPRKLKEGQGPAIFFATFINLQPGDVTEVTLRADGKVLARNRAKPASKARASTVSFTGRKSGLEKGPAYAGEALLIRSGKVIDRKTVPLRW